MTFTPPMSFAGAPLDLVENERSEADLTAFAKARKARALIMHHGQFLTKNEELVMIAPMKMVGKNIYDPGPLFLGLDGNAPIFAFSFADPVEALDMTNNANLEPLRGLAAKLGPKQLALAGRAKSLFDWHRAHKFCANCGNQSYVTNGGVTRKCPSCETDHFPRVNPVVIMLVLHEDKCLLGRGPQWPEGAYSCLAGFVSPGETMEEACVREVFEEVGVTVQDMEYRFSQPWPFPSQLMMGLSCQATNTDIILDKKEVTDAQWYSKETVRGVFNGTDKSFLCPPAFTIAHQLLQNWLDD